MRAHTARSLAFAAMLALAAAPGAFAQEDPPVDVDDGDELSVEVEGGGKERVRVHELPICAALDEAAIHPGHDYKKGKLKFKGHEDWVAKLICDFVKNADGVTSAFADYATRRRFVAHVLDKIELHVDDDNNVHLSTAAIARDHILTGESPYRMHAIQRLGEDYQPAVLEPAKMDVARSLERPDVILIAVAKRYFEVKGDDLLDWIKAGEELVLRVHALAESGRLMTERDLDWPTADVGIAVQALSRAFQVKYSLRNTGANATWLSDMVASDKRQSDFAKTRESQRKLAEVDAARVDLKIAHTTRDADHGLIMYEYAPLNGPATAGGNNPRAWFLEPYAAGQAGVESADVKPNANAKAGLEAAGITYPMWRFAPQAAVAEAFPDRLFDETSSVPVETRVTVRASCVTLIFYYTMPSGDENNPDVLTNLEAAHERRHFGNVQAAWTERVNALRAAMAELAKAFNTNLGLARDQAFELQVETITDIWRPDSKQPNLTAVPLGPMTRSQPAALFHSNPQVPQLRLRLVRKIAAAITGEALIARAKAKLVLDPKLTQIAGAWDDWIKAHWHEYERRFVREHLMRDLELDAKEGVIMLTGYGPRRELLPILARFKDDTDPRDPKKARKDPHEVLDSLRGH